MARPGLEPGTLRFSVVTSAGARGGGIPGNHAVSRSSANVAEGRNLDPRDFSPACSRCWAPAAHTLVKQPTSAIDSSSATLRATTLRTSAGWARNVPKNRTGCGTHVRIATTASVRKGIDCRGADTGVGQNRVRGSRKRAGRLDQGPLPWVAAPQPRRSRHGLGPRSRSVQVGLADAAGRTGDLRELDCGA